MKTFLTSIFLLSNCFLFANQIPVLEQCYAEFKNGILTVYYDLEDQEESSIEIKCMVFDQLTRKPIVIKNTEGDIGPGVSLGPNKSVKIYFDDPSLLPSQLLVHLSAHDGAPLDIAALLSNVSTDSILQNLNLIQGKRNATTDSLFLKKTRNFLQDFSSRFLSTKRIEARIPQGFVVNLESTQWGCESPEKVQIIDAHYDSAGQSPGADDNGSGVVGVMEAMRILAPYSSNKTIRYLFFDLEEAGLIGSQLYLVNQLNPNDQIQNCINFEMIGYYSDQINTQDLPTGFNVLFPDAYNQVISNQRRGDFITNVGNVNSAALVKVFANAATQYVPGLKVISLEVPGTGLLAPDLRRSDHAGFWDRNIPALMITDGANFRNKNYHTVRDSIHYLNMGFMTQVIKTSIATMVELAEIEHAAATTLEVNIGTSTSNHSLSIPQISLQKDVLYIQSVPGSENLILECFDLSGHLIKSAKLTGGQNIQWENNSPKSMYFLSVRNSLSQKTFKFIW